MSWMVTAPVTKLAMGFSRERLQPEIPPPYTETHNEIDQTVLKSGTLVSGRFDAFLGWCLELFGCRFKCWHKGK